MAIRLDNGGDRLRRTANLPDYNAPYTFSIWIMQLAALTSGQDVNIWSINTNSSSANYDRHALINDSGTYRIASGVVPASGGESNIFSAALSLNTWTHVAWVRLSATQIAAYVNGVQSGSTWTHTSVSGRSTSPTRFEVGAMTTLTVNPPLNLRVYANKFWTAALTAEEIAAEARMIRPSKLSSLYGVWPMLAGTNRALDYSGKANDWTAVGTLTDEAGPDLPWGNPVYFVIPAPASTIDASVTFAATSALSPGSPVFNASAGFTAAAALSPGSPQFQASAAFAASSALSATPVFNSSAAFSSTSSLSATCYVTSNASAAFAATSSLSAGNPVFQASAAFSVTAALAADGAVTANAGVSFVASSSLVAANPQFLSSAAFIVTSTLTATYEISGSIAVTFQATSSLLATPTLTTFAGAHFDATASLQATGYVEASASVVLAGASLLAAAYTYSVPGSERPAWAGTSIQLTAHAETDIQTTAFVETSIQKTAYASTSAKVV